MLLNLLFKEIASPCLASRSGSEEEEEEEEEEAEEEEEEESSGQSEGEEEEGEEESVSGSGRSEHSAGKMVTDCPAAVIRHVKHSMTDFCFCLFQKTLVRRSSQMMTLKRRGKMGITYLQVGEQVWRLWSLIWRMKVEM